VIPAELVPFLQSGLSLLVGTSSSDLRPTCCRAVGLVVAPDGANVTVFVPDATARKTLANLHQNPRAAITASQPDSHRTVQLKGQVARLRLAEPELQSTVVAYVEAFGKRVDIVGMPRSRVAQLSAWPAWAIELRLEGLFVQTPGPRAGQLLSVENPGA
jgi:hypothetical protein